MTDRLKQAVKDLPERRSLPDRRDPGWYEDLVKELHMHADRLEQRLHRFFTGCLIAFSIIGVATSISLVGFATVLSQRDETFAAIQEQRRNFVRQDCLEQNARNAETKAALIVGSDADIRDAPSKAAADEVRRRRDVALGLIDALAPRRNCDQEADQAVKETG